MENFTIQTENAHVSWALGIFFDNYKDQITAFLNNVLKNEGAEADSFIGRAEDGTLQIFQTAPDKGFVLAQVEQDKVQVASYKDLPLEAKYVIFDGQKLALYLKNEQGKADTKVGHFVNLNEAVAQIDSEGVNNAITHIKTAAKNAEVERKKAEKKAKQVRAALEKANKS